MRKGDFYSTFSQVSCEVNLHITSSFLLCATSNLQNKERFFSSFHERGIKEKF